MKIRNIVLGIGFLILTAAFVAAGCQKAAQNVPLPNQPGNKAAYVGSDACKNCHTKTHQGFVKTNHYNTFKSLSAYNITDLPQKITVFDTANKEKPVSATIDLSTVVGVMVDDYVVAPIPADAGFQDQYYRVAAVHKEGDQWTLTAASKGDYDKDGKEDWGASSYTCGSCHSPGLGNSDKEKTIGCESCHGPGGDHLAAEKKAGTMKVSQDVCLTCHPGSPTKNASTGVYEAANHYGTRNYFASKHAASDQINDCLSCHTPHATNSKGLSVIGDDPVKDNCSKCHQGAAFDLEKLMWINPTDLRNHFTKDHSFGAMPYEQLGDLKDTKETEITNPDMIKIIEEKQ